MPTGSIWLITMQKVLKTLRVKSMEQHYLGSNQLGYLPWAFPRGPPLTPNLTSISLFETSHHSIGKKKKGST